MATLTSQENREIPRATVRFSGQGWGVACGTFCGLALFVATIVLVIKGGDNVGANLSLLSVLLPAYGVTVLGAFIGFVYMFVIGYILGRVIGAVYNAVATLRP